MRVANFIPIRLAFTATVSAFLVINSTSHAAMPNAKGCLLDRWASQSHVGDPLKAIKALEKLELTPQNNLIIRQTLQEFLRNPPQGTDTHTLAMAWAWLAISLATDVEQVWNNAGYPEKALELLAGDHAFELDSSLSSALYARGYTLREFGFHYEALRSYQKAFKMDPTCARAAFQIGNEMVNLGQPRQALIQLQKALALDPTPAFVGKAYWIVGKAYFFAGDYTNAVQWLEKSVSQYPTLWFNRLYLVASYALIGQMVQAQSTLDAFNSAFPNYTVAKVRGDEEANPVDNHNVLAGRDRLYRALSNAGMREN